jgi:putative nucleotidyltransferase with HDIG domain
MSDHKITIDRLREGVFIRLDQKWFEHPFLFSSFRISNPDQIRTLMELGISDVSWDPEKSDVQPLPPKQAQTHEQKKAGPQTQPAGPDTAKLWAVKRERIARLRLRREKNEECEKQFQKSVTEVKGVMQNIEAGSRDAFEESDRLMQSIAASLMPEKEAALQLMNAKFGQENVFYHSLNVAVLSMMLGREFGLDSDMMRLLGLGALFHDIGKSRIPKKVLYKTAPLTRAELKFYQLHPRYGVDILSKLDMVSSEALQVVYQHHERNDGSGFPDGIDSSGISLFTKIVSIVDVYDNHCNRFNPRDSLTPHEALAYMFGCQRELFDRELLDLFIQYLGVYPPGTIVRLSNGLTGMVISVNPRQALHPSLMIYNPEIPNTEALIFDMTDEPDLRIECSIRPSQLPLEIHDYLSPRTRVTYYVSESAAGRKDREDRA